MESLAELFAIFTAMLDVLQGISASLAAAPAGSTPPAEARETPPAVSPALSTPVLLPALKIDDSSILAIASAITRAIDDVTFGITANPFSSPQSSTMNGPGESGVAQPASQPAPGPVRPAASQPVFLPGIPGEGDKGGDAGEPAHTPDNPHGHAEGSTLTLADLIDLTRNSSPDAENARQDNPHGLTGEDFRQLGTRPHDFDTFHLDDLPHLAEGATVTGPTVALIGEAGAEEVVPLSKKAAAERKRAENVRKAALLIFGKELSEEDIFGLAGGVPGSNTRVQGRGGEGAASIRIASAKEGSHETDLTIRSARAGETAPWVHYNYVNSESRGADSAGLGVVATQMVAMRNLGIGRVEALAARQDSLLAPGVLDQQLLNGYRTWPKLGFDAPFDQSAPFQPPTKPADPLAQDPRSNFWTYLQKLPEQFHTAKNLSELYDKDRFPGGRQAWEAHGNSINMVLDLRSEQGQAAVARMERIAARAQKQKDQEAALPKLAEGSVAPDESRPELSVEEAYRVKQYTDDGHGPLNAMLRGLEDPTPDAIKMHEALSAVMARIPTFAEPVKVISGRRRVSENPDFIPGLQKAMEAGTPVTMPGYLSTTIGSEISREFEDADTDFHINAVHGLDVSPISRFKTEKELLLPHNSQFLVRGVRQNKNWYQLGLPKYSIDLDQVAPENHVAIPQLADGGQDLPRTSSSGKQALAGEAGPEYVGSADGKHGTVLRQPTVIELGGSNQVVMPLHLDGTPKKSVDELPKLATGGVVSGLPNADPVHLVEIVAPLPIPVTIVGGSAGTAPPPPKGTGSSGLLGILVALKAAAAVFGTLKSTMEELVRAASPVAFDSLAGSVQLVAAQLGKSLIPAMAWLIQQTQKLADWIGSLDPVIMETVASIAMWVAGLTLGAVVLANVVGIFTTLWPVIAGLTAGLAAISAPIWGIVAAALAVAAAFLLLRDLFNNPKGLAETAKGYADATLKGAGEGAAIGARYGIAANGMGGVIAGGIGGAVGFVKHLFGLDTETPNKPAKLAYSKEMVPQLLAVENVRSHFQNAGLNVDPIAAENLKINRLSNQELMNINAGIKKTNGALGAR